MNKKEFTKKQLKKQLTVLTEEKVDSDIKSELKKAFKALKTLKSMLVGHKSGDNTLSFSDLKKIKTAARNIEDIYEDMVDEGTGVGTGDNSVAAPSGLALVVPTLAPVLQAPATGTIVL